MIRLSLLVLYLTSLAFFSWKDWYKALCLLLPIMAVIEHPDMPKGLLDIQGLNPWNIMFTVVALSWLFNKGKEGETWDMPRHMTVLLLLYLAVILVGILRLLQVSERAIEITPSGVAKQYSTGKIVSEYLVNTVKWPLPGLLLFHGCRSRSRFIWGTAALLAIYLILAVQVIKWMPFGDIGSGAELSARSLKLLMKEIGYHRVNLSMMLAGASWAFFAVRPVLPNRWLSLAAAGTSLVVLFAQALTGGRAGYATWVGVGLVLCVLKWRGYLLFAPVVFVALLAFVPGAWERLTMGFTEQSRDYNVHLGEPVARDEEGPDAYTVTAGRNVAWRYVVERISEAPVLGHGRLGMLTTGTAALLWEKYQENFPHPHNAYLEMLLDNGWVGFFLVVPFYLFVVKYSLSLFRDRRNPVFEVAGGVAAALVLALLFASVGSQSFYPREGSVGMWCAIGLMLRVYVERSRLPPPPPRERRPKRGGKPPSVEIWPAAAARDGGATA